MAGDRYLKIILTIIAAELLWIGIRDTAPAVAAQADATRVIIAGVDLPRESGFLPVGIAGTYANLPSEFRPQLEPAEVRATGPVNVVAQQPLRITSDRPLKIEADRPLRVESVPYTPGSRPGE
jgi:hypothetical protein